MLSCENLIFTNIMEQIIKKTPRIEVVDALRGFVIFAILLIHSLFHFNFLEYPELGSQPEILNTLDQLINKFINFMFYGKAHMIFSILFGFTFGIQFSNQQIKGNDFGYRFLWRLLLLFGFAIINSAFFPMGDVLHNFALVGVVLVIVRKWSNKAIFITAIILLIIPSDLYHFVRYLINPEYTLPDIEKYSYLYEEVVAVSKNGGFGKFIWTNITVANYYGLFYEGISGFSLRAGLFLIGLLISRTQLFVVSPKSNNFWKKGLIIAVILFVAFYFLKSLMFDKGYFVIENTIGQTIYTWQKISLAMILVASFVLLYQKPFFKKVSSPLKYYGKMSLTNYVAQSIFGFIIYFPLGFYLAPYCGYTVSFLIGCAIFTLQVLVSKWWLKNHKQGPLEGFWHKLTWINSKRE